MMAFQQSRRQRQQQQQQSSSLIASTMMLLVVVVLGLLQGSSAFVPQASFTSTRTASTRTLSSSPLVASSLVDHDVEQRRKSFIGPQLPRNNEEPLKELWSKVCEAGSGLKEQVQALKQQAGEKGVPAFLSYTLLSNTCSACCVGFAWYTFALQTGVSPLFPGQWKPFLARYAGVLAMNQFLKPVRLGLALGLTPYTSKGMALLQRKLAVSESSNGLVLALSAFVVYGASFGMMVGGVTLASVCSNTPIFPGMV